MTVYDFKNNLSPVYISVIFTLNSSLVVKTRRSADSFVESTYMKKISRKSILYLGFKIWNRFYRNIKTSTIINSFKHALKKQFLKTRFFYSIFYFLFLFFLILFFDAVMIFLLWLRRLSLLLKLLLLLLLTLLIYFYIHLFIFIVYIL